MPCGSSTVVKFPWRSRTKLCKTRPAALYAVVRRCAPGIVDSKAAVEALTGKSNDVIAPWGRARSRDMCHCRSNTR